MKKIFCAFIVFLFFNFQFSHLNAQRPHGQHEKRPEITQIVNNLSDVQKDKLETITNESRQRVDKLRSQQQSVRDSIAVFMDKEGDQSKFIYPLFDREAHLQAQISREMYSTKVQIDRILTKEQRQELQKSNRQNRKHRKK